jgi:hypothetical protein
MLRFLTDLAGRSAAWLIAVAYFVSVIMPSAALAFGDGAASAYCFEEIAEETAALHVHVHVHADGTVHHHVDQNAPDSVRTVAEKGRIPAGTHHHDADCCGAFGFAAVLPALYSPVAERATFHIRLPIMNECLVGCGPDRIDRPPIVLLPM